MKITNRRYIQSRITRQSVVEGFGECWVWTLAPSGQGYGVWKRRDEFRNAPAHRVVYETYRGAIPDALQIDHLCRNKLCVNPDHLEPVTPRVNVRRAKQYLTGRGYSLTFRKSKRMWLAAVEVGDYKHRRKKVFASLDREKAIAKGVLVNGDRPMTETIERDAELNALIDEYAHTTLYSRDTLTSLAREFPDPGFIRFVVGLASRGMMGGVTLDGLWALWRSGIDCPPADIYEASGAEEHN